MSIFKKIALLLTPTIIAAAIVYGTQARGSDEGVCERDLKHARLVNDAYYMKIRRWAGDIPTYNFCNSHVDECELTPK